LLAGVRADDTAAAALSAAAEAVSAAAAAAAAAMLLYGQGCRPYPEQVLWPDLHVRSAARQRGQHVGVVDRDRGRRRRAEESHQKPP